MGKNTWPDWDELIQKAVNAGRIQGAAMAKDTYKATERRLYALPILHSKGIVRYSRTGIRLSPEEILDGIIKDMEATIAADQYEIDTVEKALSHVKDDPFYSAIEAKYFEGLDDEDVAEDLNCGTTQLWKQRGRLVRALAVFLYGSQAAM